MGKRGPVRAAAKVVKALEAQGMEAAAVVARDAAGMEPTPLTADQQFIREVRRQVDARHGKVGFPCETADESERQEFVIKGLAPPAGYTRYVWKRLSPTYMEVVLT